MASDLTFSEARLAVSAGDARQFPASPVPQIALSGRSNVGKSSLINKILGRKALARVSGAPGKTVTVNFYDVNGKFYLVDLPGYGFAKRPAAEKAKWSALTDGYFTKNRNIDRVRLVLQLVDLKVGVTRDDEMMLSFLSAAHIPFLVVATKTDKLGVTAKSAALAALAAHPALDGAKIIPFSALTGEGKSEVLGAILSAAK